MLPSQFSVVQLQSANRPLLDQVQQYHASTAAESSMLNVAASSRQIASLGLSATSSSSSNAINPITSTNINIVDDSSGSD